MDDACVLKMIEFESNTVAPIPIVNNNHIFFYDDMTLKNKIFKSSCLLSLIKLLDNEYSETTYNRLILVVRLYAQTKVSYAII